MIFAIPAAIQTASTAAKVGTLVAVVGVIFFAGFYAGDRWESANTAKVQAKYDKLVSDSALAAQKQDGETKLENQRLRNAKELSDEENARARDSLAYYADRLQQLTKANANVSIMPRTPPNATSPHLTCFDRAELDRTDADYRAGEANRRARIHALVGKGAEATVDLNSAKLWAQKLPKQ